MIHQKLIIKLLLTIYIIFSNYDIIAQNNLKGIIKSKISNEVLPYVNIGVIGKGVGTVTNVNGYFNINISQKHYLDSIKISMIGYTPKTFLVKNFIKKINLEQTIYLVESAEKLDEIILTNKKIKTRILGNRTRSKLFSDGFDSDKLGSEAGIIIKIKKKPTYIKKFTASIAENQHKKIKFRLNFYDIKNDMPNNIILKENIIITSTIKKGLLVVDLEKYNIVVNDDFFVSLEWIEYFGVGNLDFSISLLGTPVIYRQTSHSNWVKESLIGPGFNVTVEY